MKRDEYGIIIQVEGYQVKKGETVIQNGITYTEGQSVDDGGDSAFSTGLMAFTGSEQDIALMPKFIKNGKVVRHPYQTINTGRAPHNDPAATSRDQVLAFFSGLRLQKRNEQNAVVFDACLEYAKSWRINTDICSPSNKLYLYKLAQKAPPFWLVPLGLLNHNIDFSVSMNFNPDHEMTQSTAINTIMGKDWLDALYRSHPDLFENLREYFSGWRKRAEIGERMINVVKEILNV